MARARKGEDPDTDPVKPSSAPNAVWFKPIMVGLMLIGLAWILVFYLSNMQFPIPQIGAWNLMVGFGIAFIGFLMATRWR